MKLNQKFIIYLVSAVLLAFMFTACATTYAMGKNPDYVPGYEIQDGMAQPVIEYTNFQDYGYQNKDSTIQRFCVWVETDHDTDGDGKADLVKVFAQVPTDAVEGKFKAAAIYDPTPYGVGVVYDFNRKVQESYAEEGFDYTTLYNEGTKRDVTPEISTFQLAMTENQSLWNYQVPVSGVNGYRFAHFYDYYLVRNFAVVECSGLGTNGSEGFELCGFDLEAMAHQCVVEWLAGVRVAYSDPEGTNTVKADWCNKKVAMIGCSYGGTLPFEVATLGETEGLVTVIPEAGISNWYDYTNSQGTTRYHDGQYMDYLASFNSGSLFLDDNWQVINHDYARFLNQIAKDQGEANGNYTSIWEVSDYSKDWSGITVPALIVHGLNDFNVTTVQAKLMYQAFKNASQNVKLFLHQDGHNILPVLQNGDEITKNIENRWLCHYLLGVNNGIENMPEVTYQSNIDGAFYTADDWDGIYEAVSAVAKKDEFTSTVTSKGLDDDLKDFLNKKNLKEEEMGALDSNLATDFYLTLSEGLSVSYDLGLAEGSTVYGTPTVSFKAAPTLGGYNGETITAVLIDVIDGEKSFPAYETKSGYSSRLPYKTSYIIDQETGYYGTSVVEYVKSYTKGKIISYGWMDLANPGCSDDVTDYAQDTNIETGTYYDYTFYMLPTIYTLEPGHHLELVLITYDPLIDSLVDKDSYKDYGFTIINNSLDVQIPVLPMAADESLTEI